MPTERVTYVTGTTVTAAYLNAVTIREQGPFHYVVHIETNAGVTTYYADPTVSNGTVVSSTTSADSVIAGAITNS